MPGWSIYFTDRPNSERGRGRSSELKRLADFGRVSADLIHEISTPLTSASLTLDQLKEEHSEDLIRRIQHDLKQLEHYVSVARRQLKGEIVISDFSLTVSIHQVVMLLEDRANAKGVKLLISSDAGIRLRGDPIKFHQIMANLINNAVDSYAGSANRPRFVRIQTGRRGSNVFVVVSDNGCGIGRRDLVHIFRPFFSTKQANDRGLGIGLSLVKRYIEEDYNGSIRVRSRLSKGTAFTLTFPLGGGST